MPDPYAEFQQPAAVDPYAEFAAPVKAQAPLDDLSPLRDAYTEKQRAIASGAPKEAIAEIDARINHFTGLMREAETQRQLEGMGVGGRFLAGAGRGLTNVLEHAKELSQDILPFKDREENLQRFVAERKAGEQEAAPLLATGAGGLGNIVGEAAGTAPIALATGGAGPVLGSTLAGAGTGLLLSEPDQRLQGTAAGGVAGLATGLVGKAIGGAIKGPVQPTKAAKQLQELGVEGMTAGQANPGGAVAHFEQVAESTPFWGPPVKAAREELPKSLERRIIQEAAPPGFAPTVAKDAPAYEKLAEISGAFDKAYESLVDKSPVPKNAIQNDLLMAVKTPMPEWALSPNERRVAEDLVLNQAARLDDANSLSTLHSIRSQLKKKAFEFSKDNQTQLAGHLRDIADVASNHMERAMKSNLDPEAYAKLTNLDQAYRRFSIVEDAAKRDLGGPVTITPDSLSRALVKAMTPRQYVEGGGGNLRVLARAGKQVLSPPRPVTGAMEGMINLTPVVGKYITGASGYLSSHFPRAYMGQTVPQRVLRYTLGQPLVSGAIGQAARTGLTDALMPYESPEDEAVPELPQPKVLAKTLKKGK